MIQDHDLSSYGKGATALSCTDLHEIGTADWFVLIKLEVADTKATMYYEDGNGHEHARQEIPYTDFPLPQQKMYACWYGQHWVLMMPSEY